MAVVQTNTENQQKVSLPRRIATYIASMNFAKVFRRQQPRESTSPVQKTPERPSFMPHHHQYSRPFSYHIPPTEQITPLSLTKTTNVIPYRIGLSSDSTLLANGQTNETDEIVRLPIKNGRSQSPKLRKDRRQQSQLTANKRWLFRSMETLDGWKGKVFPQKNRSTNSSQSRSRSVENLADEEPPENTLMNKNPLTIKPKRAVSPNRSIESITNRVINSIGIHRKTANSIPNITRSPALTVKKQSLFTHVTSSHNNISKHNNNETNSSAILDFREISSLGFIQSRPRLNDDNENISLTPSENLDNDINTVNDDNEEIPSNISCLPSSYDQTNDGDNETNDSWDITWIDSLKEQHSPQRKIQFYENLIKLLEQDTLNIDELLVLRKVLAKIWPTDENTTTTTDYNNQIFSTDSKTIGTKSLHAPNKIKRRSKLSTMTHHTAHRCSAIIEQSPLMYEPLHEQNSGHITKSPSALFSAKAKPCLIKNNNELVSNNELNYPQHLNPFDDEPDITPSAPVEESNHDNNDSIRRYFERLTLLETIYEKLNIESNKTPKESINHDHPKFSALQKTTESSPHNYRPNEKRMETKEDTKTRPPIYPKNKTEAKKFLEMNVDGNSSVSSEKSSLKRRAPTAPHISQNGKNNHHHQNNPTMFNLSSTDLHVPQKTDPATIRYISHDERIPKEKTPPSIHDAAASCDDDGHIFVYDSDPNQIHHQINEEQTATLPRQSDRIQQWLSTCETKESNPPVSHNNISPNSQVKMRCVTKPILRPTSSLQYYHDKTLSPPPINDEVEPVRFRSCLKIHLETNEPPTHQSRASSSTSKYPNRQQVILDEGLNTTNDGYYQRDHQAVYL